MDNNLLFRQSLKLLLTVEHIATVIGEASNGAEFMDILTKNKPDLVLISIPLDTKTTTELMQQALQYMPDLKIIAVSMFENKEFRTGMIELGVKGFLQKSGNLNDFARAFSQVMKGENYYSAKRYSAN